MSDEENTKRRTLEFWHDFPDSRTTRANELYRIRSLKGEIESQLFYTVLDICGINKDDTENWPFKDISYDYYDYSLELHECKDGWKPTAEMLEKIWPLGFSLMFVRHGKIKDANYHETSYCDPKQLEHAKKVQEQYAGNPAMQCLLQERRNDGTQDAVK